MSETKIQQYKNSTLCYAVVTVMKENMSNDIIHVSELYILAFIKQYKWANRAM